jgi:septal ring factor EnvC (AmiA/AmiB activator)
MKMVLLQLSKEIQSEPISIELTSSSPEIESGESSLSNGNSLSDVISDWKRELEEKNCMLRDKTSLIHSLEDELKQKTSEVCDVQDRCRAAELDRDKNCQMVSRQFVQQSMSSKGNEKKSRDDARVVADFPRLFYF